MSCPYLSLSDAQLLAQCDSMPYRASGPGGQKRNKTDSAIRLRHRPTGVMALAHESRSQHQNRSRALARLRQHIACEMRHPPVLNGYVVPEPLATLLPGSEHPPLGRRTATYAWAIQQLLDLFVALDCSVGRTAKQLGLSSGALSRLLLTERWVARAVGELRSQRGLRPLH